MSFVAAMVITVAVSTTAVGRTAPQDFPLVRAAGYEGAIVPASSPWHAIHRIGLQAGTSSSGAWTPDPADIATAEAGFAALLGSDALTRPPHFTTDPRDKDGVAWLPYNAQTLKRYYFGIRMGSARHILVYAVDVSRRGSAWRSEVIPMSDGSCSNLWFDFDLNDRRIVRVTCAGWA